MRHVDFFALLADPTRFRIVEVLRAGELAVGDVVTRTAVQQSGISRHLGLLRAAGVVSVRQDGQRRLYSLRKEPFREASVWMDRVRDVWEPRLDRLGQELHRRRNNVSPPNPKKEDK